MPGVNADTRSRVIHHPGLCQGSQAVFVYRLYRFGAAGSLHRCGKHLGVLGLFDLRPKGIGVAVRQKAAQKRLTRCIAAH